MKFKTNKVETKGEICRFFSPVVFLIYSESLFGLLPYGIYIAHCCAPLSLPSLRGFGRPNAKRRAV